MSSEPVSWLVVEAGWKVVSSDREEVGRVDELVGDTGKDIFNGISVSVGLLKGSRYVPSEQVAEILDGEVRLAMRSEEFDGLDDYRGAPPSTEIRPG